ncbi:STAS domain-containing protein [Planomonospora sp. ID67723]|uniref:STAS domain-containing protein n=1 Tax=Planomonospora sp. ID67723 TaxID=2738134 RepID=UPI0018C44B44|nr:STAS domain-containing protein [Planomonospora sp. ID67723]MBG0826637.1 STAS domain-containing protein [Planomonospora sp. ID67723]
MDLSTHTHPPWTVCRVTGEVDVFTAPALRAHLLAALGKPGRGVLLDLSAVTFMDASGLGVLVFVKRMLEAQEGTLRLLAPSAAVRRLLKAGGLAGQFPVSLDMAAAEQAEPVAGTA